MHEVWWEEHRPEYLEEIEYQCDWCATSIYPGEDAVNLAAYEMGIGARTRNLCLVESQLENGAHEMLLHRWCLHAALGPGMLDNIFEEDGRCTWCTRPFQFEEQVVALSSHRVAVSKRHGGFFLAQTKFPHGDEERLFHNNCFFSHADALFFRRGA